jgi:hypothetical protein
MEYFHCSLASCKRQQKGNPVSNESKMWSWVLRNFDPRVTALARSSCSYTHKLQNCPLIRRVASQEDHKYPMLIEIWSWAPGGCPIPRQTGWLLVTKELQLQGMKPNASGYDWATLCLGEINTGNWLFMFGESQIWDSKMWTWVPQDSDMRKTALVGRSSHCILRPDLSSGRAPHINKPTTV